ncbi:MAG: glycosyltransferase family 4 protein, partial [bacterium]
QSFAVVKTEHGRTEPAGNPLVWCKSRLNRWLDGVATRRTRAAVCYVTDDVGRHFAGSHHGLTRQTLYNGIDPLRNEEYSRPDDLEPDRIQLGIVGRVSAVKGITYVLEALAGLDGLPDWRLNVIGSGPLQSALESQCRQLGLAETVRFLGFRRDVYRYLAHLDLLLMPSLHEGLPYTLLEAMSLGIPVLASRVGGLAEVLMDGETGLLVPSQDSDAIRDALKRLLTEPGLASALGAAAAAQVRQKFTLDHMGDRYWQVYEAAVAEWRRDVG